MLSEKEEKAIERLDRIEVYNTGDGEAIDTVLNLITKLQKENEEKDKQIDLMANYIVDLIKYNNPEEKREVEEIKQYFERKSKKWKRKKK